MKTRAGKILTTLWLVWLCGLWCVTPGKAFPISPPQETLAGLTPGINTVADASRLYGNFNTQLPGRVSAYAGGPNGTDAYRWTNGPNGMVPGLIVETPICSPVINYVVVEEYPGLATSCGLMALMPESRVPEIYGLPDFAYELRFNGYLEYRELFYIERGLMVVTAQMNGRTTWTVDKIILTYPTYLRNAVAFRSRAARSGSIVSDITDTFEVWVHVSSANPKPPPTD